VIGFALKLALAAVVQPSGDQIDSICNAAMTEAHIPGMVVGVFRRGEPVSVRAYGQANLETKSPVTRQTVFRIASISKQFTASAVMMLVKEGKLRLEDPVRKHLVDAPDEWEPVTIRHMLTHTSGIPEPTGFQYTGNYDARAYLALFRAKPLTAAPGEVYAYNNHAYAALSLVVANVAGKPMREFVSERILNPLEMNTARFFRLEDVVPNRADGSSFSSGRYVNRLMLRPEVFDGSGGLMMTIDDYGKWDRALWGDSLLDNGIKSQMWTPFKLKSGRMTSYGFGWTITGTGATAAVSHNGSTFGFTSRVKRHLGPRLSVVIFQNGAGPEGAINRLEAAISSHYLTPTDQLFDKLSYSIR